MSEERCEKCRFWKRSADEDVDDESAYQHDSGTQSIGGCYRLPPVLMRIDSWCRTDDRIVRDTFHPVTHEWDWCGEFQKKDLLAVHQFEESDKTGEFWQSLPVVVCGYLERAGLHTAEKVAALSAEKLLTLRGIGTRTLEQIREALSKTGMKLKGD